MWLEGLTALVFVFCFCKELGVYNFEKFLNQVLTIQKIIGNI